MAGISAPYWSSLTGPMPFTRRTVRGLRGDRWRLRPEWSRGPQRGPARRPAWRARGARAGAPPNGGLEILDTSHAEATFVYGSAGCHSWLVRGPAREVDVARRGAKAEVAGLLLAGTRDSRSRPLELDGKSRHEGLVRDPRSSDAISSIRANAAFGHIPREEQKVAWLTLAERVRLHEPCPAAVVEVDA